MHESSEYPKPSLCYHVIKDTKGWTPSRLLGCRPPAPDWTAQVYKKSGKAAERLLSKLRGEAWTGCCCC